MRKFPIGAAAIVLVAAALTACGGGGSTGVPQAKAGTLLRRIQDRGKLIVGVKYDTPSFGYLINPLTNTVGGIEPAIGREIAAYIFGDPSKIEFKEAVTANRIPFLMDGTVDVILATFTITADRLKQVDCSVVYYVQGDRLLVQKDSSVKGLDDLDGKKVAVKTGSGAVDVFTKQTSAQVIQVSNSDQQLQMLLDRQVDAINGNDISLYGIILDHPTLKVVGPQFRKESLGAAIAKGNPELLDVINTVIKNLKASGKWKGLWKAEIGDKFGLSAIPDPPDDAWANE